MATYDEAYVASLEYYNGDDLAASTFVNKYALRDNDNDFKELSPDDMHRRLSKEFARIEKRYPNPLSEEEIYGLLKDFKFIVPQGSPMAAIGNQYQIQSLSNCVVVESPQDSIESIMDRAKDTAQLYKRRCGVGTDLSNLRPDGTTVNNAARTTTGAWSFADFYSYVCRMIGQNSRRGALMLTMDIRHPDVEKFAVMKRDKSKVTGANVSIKINDDFMRAVRDDNLFTLQWPVDSADPKVVREIKARDLWKVVIESVHQGAEPGLLMWDNITRELPAHYYPGFECESTNPCSEIPLSVLDACRLTTVNLTGFVLNKFQKDAQFDFKNFEKVVNIAQRLMDDLVDLEIESIDKIISIAGSASEKSVWKKLKDSCTKGRRTGLGTFGLADTLAQLRIRYDSDEALEMTGKIFECFRNSAYQASIEMAEERGGFPIWDWEVEKDCPFVKRLPKKIIDRMKKSGRRNIALLTNAPTGSVAIVSFNSSSGIEPVFRNFYTRRKKINHDDKGATVDFVDHLGDKWQEFNVFHRNISDWIKMNNPDWDGSSIPDLPKFFITSDQIDWKKRVKLQSVIQSYIDHAISSTINLPAETTIETVGELYLKGWEEGLKGITIYREGSRTGVLVSNNGNGKDKEGRPKKVNRTHAPRRPEVLSCDIYHGVVQGQPWVVVVGLLNGEPYELFGGPGEDIALPKAVKSGFMRKTCVSKNKNRYDLMFSHHGTEVVIGDVGNIFGDETHSTFTRMISLSLRHGAPVQYVVEQLGKNESEDLFSISSILRRALKKYIIDGTTASSAVKTCDVCGSPNLKYQDGCPTCLDCSFSKCS